MAPRPHATAGPGQRAAAALAVAVWVAVGGAGVPAVAAGPVGGTAGGDRPAPVWALRAPVESQPPGLRAGDRAGDAHHPVDAFVLDGLRRQDLLPSPPASRHSLVRRLSFDLRGLPPTSGEADRFSADAEPGAWARLVDRFLDDPAFGERMASMWLNVMRYAEDQAHQVGEDTKHFYPNAFLYRDWVVAAFNRDLPYDRFVRLQLAADQVGAPEEDLPALGFIGLGPKYYQRNNPRVMADEWEDRVDAVGRGLLGLTVACARCHDHKSDPLTMHDYQALAGVFASTDLVNQPYQTDESKLSDEEKEKNLHTAHVVRDGDVRDLPLFLRGDPEQKGDPVPRRFIAALCDGEPEHFTNGSGRLELAEAIVDPGNPLTARVFANRVWALVMGRGIVATTSDFGALGSPPSHPELLDWLARDFVENGWSAKHLVRRIVTSATYRQSSAGDPEMERTDGDNRFWWRAERKRLTAEMLRDAVLAASGELEPGGGRSFELGADPGDHRRTLYARVSRLQLDPFLLQFDYPDPNIHSPGRTTTTSPLQKLFLMNSPFAIARAEALADRCGAGDADTAAAAFVHTVYRTLFARAPDGFESGAGTAFLENAWAGGGEARRDRATLYAQALLLSNEMLYVD